MKNFDGFKKTGIDSDIENRIAAHCKNFKITHFEAVNLFTVLVRRQLLKRFLAHLELFKMTLDIPGDIDELGVLLVLHDSNVIGEAKRCLSSCGIFSLVLIVN